MEALRLMNEHNGNTNRRNRATESMSENQTIAPDAFTMEIGSLHLPHEDFKRRIEAAYPIKLIFPCSLLFCLVNLMLIALELKLNTYASFSLLTTHHKPVSIWYTPLIIDTCAANLFYSLLAILTSNSISQLRFAQRYIYLIE
jgi:hypothetical protein